jgi:hypothetical protein
MTLEMQSGPGFADCGELLWDSTYAGSIDFNVTISLTENITGQIIEQQMNERLEML